MDTEKVRLRKYSRFWEFWGKREKWSFLKEEDFQRKEEKIF